MNRALLITVSAAAILLPAGGAAARPDGHCGCGNDASIPSSGQPSWSPDGRRIAFSRDDPGFGSDIYVMNADGSRQRPLLRVEGGDYNPEWAPDGKRIVFAGYRGENSDLFAVNADGSGLTRLTTTPQNEGDPDWSPDGNSILFARAEESSSQLYVMNADGSNVRRLLVDTDYDQSRPGRRRALGLHSREAWKTPTSTSSHRTRPDASA